MRALRWIDPQTRSADLGVSVCIATDETPLLSPPVEFNHWNQLSSSDLAMARSLPPEAAIPAYPAQNETCCRSAKHRISALAIGPRIAEKGWRPVWCGEGTYGDRWRTTQGATRADSLTTAGQYDSRLWTINIVMIGADRAPCSSTHLSLLRPLHCCIGGKFLLLGQHISASAESGCEAESTCRHRC